MSDGATVVEKLSLIMDALPGIGKDERSPEGYSYRGIEAIAKHLQPLLAKHGVIISPLSTMVSQNPSTAMKEGWSDTILDVEWRIYGPAGDHIDARTQGIGRDKSDKGAAKALTQARKNLLLSLFSIADKADDADGQTYEHDRKPEGEAKPEPEPSAPDEAREKALAAVKELSQTGQEAVKVWLKANHVPALTKAEGGPTLTQLNDLTDYIVTLTSEPFSLGGDKAPPKPENADVPFNPVVAARAHLTGTERKQRDAVADDLKVGRQ